MIIEYVLERGGRSDASKLEVATRRFLRNRKGIADIQQLPNKHIVGAHFEYHKGPNNWADYYLHFGDYWAAKALKQLPESKAKPLAIGLAQILVTEQKKDGSWVDFKPIGPAYGTASVVATLRELRPLLPAPAPASGGK